MGNISSLSSGDPVKEAKLRQKAFIESLGNRYPFGDDELIRILYYHEYILSNSKTDPKHSFLQCLSMGAISLSSPGKVQEILNKVEIMERTILPPSFGNILEQNAFSSRSFSSSTHVPQPVISLSSNTPIHNNQHLALIISSYEKDESKMHHLETFLQGLAECCGRRGGRYTLGVLFQCCRSTSDSSSFNLVDASQLLELIYRIALACMYLSSSSSLNSNQNDDYDHIPMMNIKKPEALIQSLIEASKTKSGESSAYSGGNFSYSQFGGYGSSLYSTSTSTSSSTNIETGKISKEQLFQWAEETAPLLSSVLPTFFHQLLFSDKPFPPSRTPFLFPYFLNNGDNDNNTQLSFLLGGKDGNDCSSSYPLLFSFACMSHSLGGMWYRLFSSDADGMSFNRLLKALLGYSGPTLLMLTSTSGSTFGAFTSSKWIESKSFYGNSDCFLYQLEPMTNVYRPRGGAVDDGGGNRMGDGSLSSSGSSNRNYMYCNPEARSKGFDGLAHGIGFGGDAEKPRLFITETLDGCIAQSDDLTFARGNLLSPDTSSESDSNSNKQRQRDSFEIERMEVWGVGGDAVVKEALTKRQEHRDLTAANIKKARKVDKAQFLDDFKSGLIESKAFQHREQMRGRDDAQIDDEHGDNAYKYE